MKRADKITLTVGAILAIALIAWLLWRRYMTAQAAGNTPAVASNPNSQDLYAGPTGLPITPQIQYGQGSGAFQLNLGTITLPGFHYSGNHQIYMPLFGFVGYSNYANG